MAKTNTKKRTLTKRKVGTAGKTVKRGRGKTTTGLKRGTRKKNIAVGTTT